LVLVAAPVLLCSPVLLGSRTFQAEDFRDYFGPHAIVARDEVRTWGELPRWNPYQYAGVPYVGTGQNNFYYPPNALFLLLPVDRAFGIVVALHLLLATIGMYRLARSYRLRREAATVAGLAFGLSFSVIGRMSAGHLPNAVTMCVAPAVLALLVRCVRKPTMLHVSVLATVGGVASLGGTPQFLVHLGLVSIAVTLGELWIRSREGQRVAGAGTGVAVAAAGALGISAVYVLPLIEVASSSNRMGVPDSLITPFHDFTVQHLVLLTVPRFFWNSASDPWLWWEKALYPGLLSLGLAVLALGRLKRWPVPLYVGIGLAALAEALTGRLLGVVPGYGSFRIPERVIWVLVLSLSLLAAVGWERVLESADAFPRKAKGLLGVGLGLAAWAGVLILAYRARGEAVLFAAAGGGVIAAFCYGARAPWMAAVLVALDLCVAGVLQLQAVPREAADPPPWYERRIGPERDSGRLLDLVSYKAAPVSRGFRLLRGYGHPVLPALAELYASAWTGTIPSLDTLPSGGGLRDVTVLRDLNVRWIVSGGPPAHPEWKLLAREGGRLLYEDPGARGDAFLVGTAGAVGFQRRGTNAWTVQARAETPGTLVVSEAWAPGWTADLDGKPVGIGLYRNALMSVDLPAGSSTLRFSYRPRGWKTGRGISLVSLLAGVSAVVVALVRRRRPPTFSLGVGSPGH